MASSQAPVQSGPRTPLWILNPALDLILFVGTPALILPAILLAERFWSSNQIYLFVASFGAVGHHLPGMMRAYGDRALFSRFRIRFIVSPIFLLTVCLYFAFHARSALLLVVFAWGMWHGLMQAHGFARIYDAKVKSFGRITAMLDQLLFISWFASAIVFSPTRVYWFLDQFFQAGGPAVHGPWLSWTRTTVGVLTVAITLAWIANAIRAWKEGHPPSVVKILLIVTSIGFYTYANVVVRDLLIAVVLFEIFHDVQYLSIVWVFNRKRVEADPEVGQFTHFLFRPRTWLIGFYVGLVFLYGSLNYMAELLPDGMMTKILVGALAASALLHFYYDGFIWKVREKETRASLGLEGSEHPGQSKRWIPVGARHILLWILLFVVPVGLLAMASQRGAMKEEHRVVALAEAFPEDAAAQRNLAIALYQDGDLDGAIEANRRAAELSPYDTQTREKIEATLALLLVEKSRALLDQGKHSEAVSLLEEAHRYDAKSLDSLIDHATRIGQQGDHWKAVRVYRTLLQIREDSGHLHYNMAASLATLGRLQEARSHAARSVELLPGEPLPQEMVRRIDEALATQP